MAAAAAPEAMPVNPSTAATMAMIRKITVHRNIIVDLKIHKTCVIRCMCKTMPFYFCCFAIEGSMKIDDNLHMLSIQTGKHKHDPGVLKEDL